MGPCDRGADAVVRCAASGQDWTMVEISDDDVDTASHLVVEIEDSGYAGLEARILELTTVADETNDKSA